MTHDNGAYVKLLGQVRDAILLAGSLPSAGPLDAEAYADLFATTALAVVDSYLGMPVTEFPEAQFKAGVEYVRRGDHGMTTHDNADYV